MSGTASRAVVGCLVGALVCGFVAWERYQANAESVRTMNESPLALALTGGRPLEPTMPVATKYALFFGALFLAGALASWAASRRSRRSAENPRSRIRSGRPRGTGTPDPSAPHAGSASPEA